MGIFEDINSEEFYRTLNGTWDVAGEDSDFSTFGGFVGGFVGAVIDELVGDSHDNSSYQSLLTELREETRQQNRQNRERIDQAMGHVAENIAVYIGEMIVDAEYLGHLGEESNQVNWKEEGF